MTVSVLALLVVGLGVLVLMINPERLLFRILSAAPTCTLWRYDFQREVYYFRPYRRLSVTLHEICEAKYELRRNRRIKPNLTD